MNETIEILEDNNNKDVVIEKEKTFEEIEKDILNRIKILGELINVISGQASIQSRIDPITNPKNWKTTTILNKGEVITIHNFLMFAKQSPYECISMVEWCEEYAYLKLSESGFAIEQGISLAKTFAKITEKFTSQEIERPTQGMRDKEK